MVGSYSGSHRAAVFKMRTTSFTEKKKNSKPKYDIWLLSTALG